MLGRDLMRIWREAYPADFRCWKILPQDEYRRASRAERNFTMWGSPHFEWIKFGEAFSMEEEKEPELVKEPEIVDEDISIDQKTYQELL